MRRDDGKVGPRVRRDGGKVGPRVRRDDGKVGLVERSKSGREIRRQFAPSLRQAPLWGRGWRAAGDDLVGRGRLVHVRGSGFGRHSDRWRSKGCYRWRGPRPAGRYRRDRRRSSGRHRRSGRRSRGRYRRDGRRSSGRHRRSGRRSSGRHRRSGCFGWDWRCDRRRPKGQAGRRWGHRRSGLSGRRTGRRDDKRVTAFGAPHLETAGRNTAFVDLVGSLARLALDLEHVYTSRPESPAFRRGRRER